MQTIAAQDGNPDFFMFGEVALDGSGAAQKSFTSHYTTHDQMQAVLDFPFQDAARGFASKGLGNQQLAQFFANDDWYTDRDSNVYELPTFLGNHDMGRIGHFLQADNPGADDAELLARDRLAHELMYFSRGNPVVYYGDEQGFTGDGRRPARPADDVRQPGAGVPGRRPDRHRPDRRPRTTSSPATRCTSRSRRWRRSPRSARRSATAPSRSATPRAGRGSSRSRGSTGRHQKEYVVALNNSEAAASADVPTFLRQGRLPQGVRRRAGRPDHPQRPHACPVSLPGLSTAVYVSDGPDPALALRAPKISLERPAPAEESHGRIHVAADVHGDSFYEVTFQRKVGHGSWQTIGVDDSAPYQVYDDVSSLTPGRRRLLPRGGARQRRAHRAARSPRSTTRAADPGHDVRARGRRHGEQDRPGGADRDRRPGAAAAVGRVPAQRRRRPLDQPRHGQLGAGVHHHRRRLGPAARHVGPLPRDPAASTASCRPPARRSR